MINRFKFKEGVKISFQTPITIKEAIGNIHRKKYLLPALQRDLVWDHTQIERLFDSLMRDYPIGSFLFWRVEKDKSKDFQFYDFIVDYHQLNNKHIKKTDISGEDNITAILDGQQRLTALYIGFKGTYAYKLPRKRFKNPLAYPKRKLYLNLLKKSNKMDIDYDFKFLTNEQAQRKDEDHYWFRVGEILNFEEQIDVNEYFHDYVFTGDRAKDKFASSMLFKLYNIVNNKRIINFYLEKSKELDKVLNIFIRINSGGTPLSYSDLLLSIATTQWKDRDAREEIIDLIDNLNLIGDGFKFNIDFVLKSCLVLNDFNIVFKVDNFKKDNMLIIEKNWKNISDALMLSIELFSNFGYDDNLLTANYSAIPIAYYLLKKDNPQNFIKSGNYKEDREKIRKWLNICLLKRIFGGQSDKVLRLMREVILENNSSFPFHDIVNKLKGTTKSMIFDSDEIDNLLFNKYGEAYTFSSLALLYPTLDFTNKFHIDHIFPKSFFTRSKLSKMGISNIEFYMNNFNYLGNLQLLDGTMNEEKSNKDFAEWLDMTFDSDNERKDYLKKHYIPDVDLSFDNFEEFIDKREELMVKEFESILTF